jgi:hypothetical protein
MSMSTSDASGSRRAMEAGASGVVADCAAQARTGREAADEDEGDEEGETVDMKTSVPAGRPGV